MDPRIFSRKKPSFVASLVVWPRPQASHMIPVNVGTHAQNITCKSNMAPPGDLMDLSNHVAAKEHTAAVVRDYISQPRLSKCLSKFVFYSLRRSSFLRYFAMDTCFAISDRFTIVSDP